MQEPSRHVSLPNNAMWLLDYLQDKFYDVRGPTFVIQRAEAAADHGSTLIKAARKRGPLACSSSSKNSKSNSLALINRVVQQHPGSIMLLEGGVVDVSDWMQPVEVEEEASVHGAEQQQAAPGVTSMAANTTCTGIVRVEQEGQEEEEQLEADVFYTNSTSPRRTKTVGFTCKCCGARTYSRVNPKVFHEGTLVAQCAKCERWHKLSDHFGLFHELQGPIFGGRPLIVPEDVPESLRLRAEDEVEGGEWLW